MKYVIFSVYKATLLGLMLVLISITALAQTSGTVLDSRAQIDRLLDENEALRRERDNLVRERDGLLVALDDATNNSTPSAQVADLEAEINRHTSALANAETTIDRLQEELRLSNESEKEASDKVRTLLDENAKAKQQQQELSARLLEIQEQYDRELRELTDRTVRNEELLERCELEKGQACAVTSNQCEDIVETQVTGILATIRVVNECRSNSRLTVRLRPTDLLPARMVTEFDRAGVAELTFPILDGDTRLRLLGGTEGANHDLSLSPQDQFDEDFVVLRWEDQLVNLDLIMESMSSGESASENNKQTQFGEIVLAQGLSSQQVPRFEIFSTQGGSERLQVIASHANRRERAEPPFCGQAEAASPTFLLMVRDRDGFRQSRGEFESVPCGQSAPAGGWNLKLDRFNPR